MVFKEYRKKGNGVEILTPLGVLQITLYRSDIVRVYHGPPAGSSRDSLVVVRNPLDVSWNLHCEEDGLLTITTDKLKILIDMEEGVVSFEDSNGRLLLRDVNRNLLANKDLEKFYTVTQEFTAVGHGFYGLGQHPGIYNYNGCEVTLLQSNWEVAIPILVSSLGYAIMWDNYSMTRVKVEKIGHATSRVKWWSEAAEGIDYYLLYGPSLDEVIAAYRWLTGSAPLLPKWAYGYWQSRERYKSQEELVSVAREFRRRGIPIDIIVQDWMYWGKYGWNAFKFDEENYPDPRKMVEDIHALDMHMLISIWPIFGEETQVYKEMLKRGFILPGTRCYDPYNSEAGQLYWEYIKNSFFDIGVDGWWLDATEPETGLGWASFYTPMRETRTAMGPGAYYLNTFSLMSTKAVYEGQRSVSDKRVVILTRSSFLGQQRYSAITWSGDILHDWGELRRQIPAGLNFSISGVPYWTTDIGGFFSGNPGTKAYREIFTRWIQWGVFCPIFRVHGTTYPKEPWCFGDETEALIIKFIKFRYRLLPYIYSLAWKVTSEGYTIMRPLVMDFQNDPNVADIDDQYMFGPSLMVSPITLPNVDSRKVYLPPTNGGWYDFWTGKRIMSTGWIDVPAPIDKIPLHVKAGSILPLGSPTSHALEDSSVIELRIYAGANGSFILYEDDGETYAYERGEYATIPVEWREEERTLIIGERKGSFPGMSNKKTFHVVLVGEGAGVGIEEARPDEVVEYSGKRLVIKL